MRIVQQKYETKQRTVGRKKGVSRFKGTTRFPGIFKSVSISSQSSAEIGSPKSPRLLCACSARQAVVPRSFKTITCWHAIVSTAQVIFVVSPIVPLSLSLSLSLPRYAAQARNFNLTFPVAVAVSWPPVVIVNRRKFIDTAYSPRAGHRAAPASKQTDRLSLLVVQICFANAIWRAANLFYS